MRAMVSFIGGFIVAALMWPTSDCVRTLIGGHPNPPSCTSAVGLPTHPVVAVVLGLVAALVVCRMWGKKRKS